MLATEMIGLVIFVILSALPFSHQAEDALRIRLSLRNENTAEVQPSCNLLSLTILSTGEIILLKEMSKSIILTNTLSSTATSSNKMCLYQDIISSPSRVISLSTVGDLLSGFILINDEKYVTENTSVASPLNEVDFIPYSQSPLAHGPGGQCGVVTKPISSPLDSPYKTAPSTLNFINNTIVDYYLELYVIADYTFYVKNGANTENYIAQIVNNVDALYRQQGIHILLVGVEVWKTTNKITISTNAQTTLTNLVNYRSKLTIHHDVLHLLSGYTYSSGVLGIAYVGAMCNFPYSCGLSSDNTSTSAYQTSVTMAHEMGHNLGFVHDTTSCACGRDSACIMATSVSASALPSQWSNCSLATLSESKMILQAMRCLQDLPDLTTISNVDLCGNGVVDGGEDCDPGLLNTNSTCCDPATCKFRAGARCSSGRCCNKQTCQVYSGANLCRPASNECDLPEYCDGISEHCANDRFKINSTPCDSTKGFCYSGQCISQKLQCQRVMGATGSSSNQCYTTRNVKSSNGYCSYYFSTFPTYYTSVCSPQNAMCGQLHCSGYANNRANWFTINNASVNGEMCFYGTFDLTLTGFRDPLMTPNGAPCGTNSWCMNSVCQSVSSLPSGCLCSGHGVCNDLGNCHCDNGYYGDDCSLTGGCGGSIDNGPACTITPSTANCPSSYCNNGGTCVFNTDGYQCLSGATYCCRCLANYLEPKCVVEAQKATQITLTSLATFKSDYENPSSTAYKEFDKALSHLVRWAFKLKFGVSQISVRTLQIRRGSTIGQVVVKGGADLITTGSSIIASISQLCNANDTFSQVMCNNSLIQSPSAVMAATLIDSCSAGNDCSGKATCTSINTVNYTCTCKSGYKDDFTSTTKEGRFCIPKSDVVLIIILVVSIGGSLLIIAIIVIIVVCLLKKKKKKNQVKPQSRPAYPATNSSGIVPVVVSDPHELNTGVYPPPPSYEDINSTAPYEKQ